MTGGGASWAPAGFGDASHPRRMANVAGGGMREPCAELGRRRDGPITPSVRSRRRPYGAAESRMHDRERQAETCRAPRGGQPGRRHSRCRVGGRMAASDEALQLLGDGLLVALGQHIAGAADSRPTVSDGCEPEAGRETTIWRISLTRPSVPVGPAPATRPQRSTPPAGESGSCSTREGFRRPARRSNGLDPPGTSSAAGIVGNRRGEGLALPRTRLGQPRRHLARRNGGRGTD